MITSELTTELIRELTLLTKKDKIAICRAFSASVVKTDEGEYVIELVLVERELGLPVGFISKAIAYKG